MAVGALLIIGLAVETVEAQTRPTRAIGYSAAERDRVDQLLSKTKAQRDAYADRVGVSRRLMRSLAEEIGLANPKFSDQQFFQAVEAMAQRAVTLETDNERLRQELQRVSDPSFRSEATTLAEEAQLALDEGRLMDAELLFGRLRELRWQQDSAAQEALNTVIEAEARTAELRQDFDRARDLRLDAAQRELDNLDRSRVRAFDLASAAARGKAEEGETFGRPEALDNAIAIWRDRVLPIVPQSSHPTFWARAQSDLADALALQGSRTDGAEGTSSLEEARSALNAALSKLSAAQEPEYWSLAQHRLGYTLTELSERKFGRDARGLLEEAEAAYKQALSVRSQENTPDEWGDTHHSLAVTLTARADRSDRDAESNLLERATFHYDQALLVRTRDSAPDKWAATIANKALIKQSLSYAKRDAEALELLRESEAAYRDILSIYTRETRPVDWALIQNNLGAILADQAARTNPANAPGLLDKAFASYDAALGVYSRDNLPLDWSRVMAAIGSAQRQRGMLAHGDEARSWFERSIASFRAALEVQSKEKDAAMYYRLSAALASSLTALGEATEGEAGLALLKQALEAYRLAGLETIEEYPRRWAEVNNETGRLEYMIAMRSEPMDKRMHLLFADVFFSGAHYSYEKHDIERDQTWADATSNLGLVRRERALSWGELQADRIGLLEQSGDLLQDALDFQIKAKNLPEIARINYQIGMTAMFHGLFLDDEGGNGISKFEKAKTAFRNAARYYTADLSPGDFITSTRFVGDMDKAIAEKKQGQDRIRHLEDARQHYLSARAIAKAEGFTYSVARLDKDLAALQELIVAAR